ncbi:MAG: hypothetical protein NC310_06525 [Roseburia sp.]|nr:hypothetical protein [Anaeroplasma bactoclasticum]MCM1196704.1 hypothetical protein [Roseburia sp.]MCM1557736.1 hypothetical protein [Anaeroplasma bactoclasticum]
MLHIKTILATNPDTIIPEIKQTIDDEFRELFLRNYIWLIILAVVTLILLLLFIIIHLISNHSRVQKVNEYISSLEKKIFELERQVNTLSSVNRDTLSELNKLNLKLSNSHVTKKNSTPFSLEE